ncbi:hypothetical protein ACQP2F_31205 [Actinoplanes sp. CA-030573]|uniref:hypothetical protein n=1 Tax=Actinoplanes sp. CA-030573 TaxID=3239898 RepID=UPI003D900487
MERLPAGARLASGDELRSGNGRVRLVLQSDGNLVLYRTDDGAALWASGTAARPVAYGIMQGDGNLVAYAGDGRPLWASGTHGHPGAEALLQDDGNLVVYDAAGRALWATHTVQWFGPRFVPGFRPSANAPLFGNGPWPMGTRLEMSVLGLPPIKLDATRMGLCGGMSFLTRDIFESGTPQLRERDPSALPRPVAQHILARLLDSFGGAPIVKRWLAVTRESDAALRKQTMSELPAVLGDIDAGTLCPVGVVMTESIKPWAVFENHVELVWGYERHGAVLTLHMYDCNRPGRDDVVIEVDTAVIRTNGTGNDEAPGTVRGFFRLPYRHQDPSPAYAGPVTAASGG